MHILRLTPHFFRPGDWPPAFSPVGGMQHQTLRITESLAAAGVRHTVLTSYIPGSPRAYELPNAVSVRAVGPWLPHFAAYKFLTQSWFVGLLPEIRSAAGRYDLVHLHLNGTIWCRRIATIVGRTGVPLVVSLNTALWGGTRQTLRLEGKPWDFTRSMEAAALQSASAVVALTDGTAAYAVDRMALPASRVVVIPDAVDPANYRRPIPEAELDAFRIRHGIPRGRRIVAYVGRISAEKGWRDLPGILQRLADAGIFLLICGDGLERERGTLERQLSAVSPERSWSITGFVPPEEVAVAMRLSDVLILPSRAEAFGSVLLEAMASGAPAVAYATGGIPDVAGTPPAVALAPVRDVDALVALVRGLLDGGETRRALVERGRQRVEEFTLDAAAAKHLRLYRSLVSPGGGVQEMAGIGAGRA